MESEHAEEIKAIEEECATQIEELKEKQDVVNPM